MKKKKSTSRKEGWARFPLWQRGLFLIVIGPVSNQVASLVMPAPANSAAASGQAFGRGLVAVVCVIAGVVMIAMHFVRRGRR